MGGEAVQQADDLNNTLRHLATILPSHVLVVHVFQHPQLSVGPLGMDCGLEGSGDLLDRHTEIPPVSADRGRAVRGADLDSDGQWMTFRERRVVSGSTVETCHTICDPAPPPVMYHVHINVPKLYLTVGPGPDPREVLVLLRDLPDRPVELYAVVTLLHVVLLTSGVAVKWCRLVTLLVWWRELD